MSTMSLGKSTAQGFILASLLFLLLGIIEGLMHPTKFAFQEFYAQVLGLEPAHIKPFFGHFVSKIHTHVALVGWVSTGLMGVLYYVAEEIKGGARYKPLLCASNLILQVGGVVILAAGFHLVGIMAVPTGHAAGSPEFRAAAQSVKPVVVAGGVTLLMSGLIFIYNICSTLLGRSNKSN